MRLILSCFHMDGTGNGENNDNLSPLRVFYQASRPPATPSPVPSRPNQVAPRQGRALGCRWWWLRLPLGHKSVSQWRPRPVQPPTRHPEGKPSTPVLGPAPAERGTGIKAGRLCFPTCTLSQAPFVPCPPTHLCANAAAAQMFSIKA